MTKRGGAWVEVDWDFYKVSAGIGKQKRVV